MSDGILRYTTNLLLTRNNAAIECCCVGSPSLYYEAVPCDAALYPNGAVCADVVQCAVANNLYLQYQSFCNGTQRSICECQVVRAFSYGNGVVFNYNADVFELNLADSNYTTGYITVNDSAMVLTAYPTGIGPPQVDTFNFSGNYQSFASLVGNVDALGYWAANVPGTYSDSSSVYSFAPTGGLKVIYGGIAKLDGHTRTKLGHGSSLSPWINSVSGNIDVFVTGIYNLCSGTLTSLLLNDPPGEDLTRWHLLWTANSCGQEFKPVFEAYNGILLTNGSIINSSGEAFEFIDGYRQATMLTDLDGVNHRIVGSGDIYAAAGDCPWGRGTDGLPRRDDGTRCCPQKGCLIGPDNYVGPTGSVQHSLADLSQLDQVVNLNGGCYVINPLFFEFGTLGRFKPTLVDPDLPIWTSGNNGIVVPQSAAVRLFMASFNKDLPWGGFGSYYHGIYGANNICGETAGEAYAPYGEIRAVGEWLKSDYIWLKFKFYEPIPFQGAVCGNQTAFIDYLISGYTTAITGRYDYASNATERVAGLVDEGTLSNFQILAKGPSNHNYYTLTYACTGRTVQNFIDDLNGITSLVTVSNGTTTDSCKVFAACNGLPEAATMPLVMLTNASSDLFELGWACHTGNGGYMPDEDGPKLTTANVFGPKSYLDTFPTFSDLGSSGNIPAITTYPQIYDTTSLGTVALLPPKNRISALLPNQQSGVCTGPLGFANGTSQWFYALEIFTDRTCTVANTGLRFPYTSLLALVTGSQFQLTASGFGVPLSTGYIKLNHNGSGYTVTDFSIEATGFTLLDCSGHPWKPLVVTSGIQPWNVWLDDSTWQTGNAPYPRTYPGVTKTVPNYAYLEPFIQQGPYELGAGVITPLWNRMRRRSWAKVTGIGPTYYVPDLPDSISPMGRVNQAKDIDCSSNVTVDRSWITSYGCTSYNCKTQFYYKADRCGCADTWDGADCHSQPNGNTPVVDTTSYPTVYICKNNVHPNCTMTFLVKPPIQTVSPCGPTSTGCPASYWAEYNGLAPNTNCVSWNDSSAWLDDDLGWCQFISQGNVVREEDIPRTWPATAVVEKRQVLPFCPDKPYLKPFQSYTRLVLVPWVPPEYIDPVTGDTCDGTTTLDGAARPIVQPFTEGDWTGDNSCDRIDVDCGPKCCGCFFLPQVQGTGCCSNAGPYRCNCEQQVVYEIDFSHEDLRGCCSIQPEGSTCVFGCCELSTTILQPWIADGKVVTTYQVKGQLTYHNGCCQCDGVVQKHYTFTDGTTCNGNYSGDPNTPVYNCCSTSPSPGAGYIACNSNVQCSPPNDEVNPCPSNPHDLDNSSDTGSNPCGCSTYGDVNVKACRQCISFDDGCLGSLLCSTAREAYGWVCSALTLDPCGYGTSNWKFKNVTSYNGIAPEDGVGGCVSGEILGFQNANPSNGGVYHGVLNEELVGKITFGPIFCDSCNFSASTLNFSAFENIIAQAGVFVCGQGLD